MEDYDIEELFESFLQTHDYKKVSSKPYTSFYINYDDIISHSDELAKALISDPSNVLTIMEKKTIELFDEEAEYITVRVMGIPITPFRDLSSVHLNTIVSLQGMVNMISEVKPLLVNATFLCGECGNAFTIHQSEQFMEYPEKCVGKCRNRKFLWDEKNSIYIDSQDLSIQEGQEELPAGQIPRILNLRVTRDLKEIIRAGNLITVSGIYRIKRTSEKTKDITFNTYIEVNHVTIETKEASEIDISEEDEERIISLSKEPDIHEQLIKSLVPSIYGYEVVKESILYLLFGGVKKEYSDAKIRGELNILLIGDPACAKTQLLRAVAKYAPRAIFTSGRGATGAGLTAATIPQPKGGFVLVAGALALGDKGIVCIDEMDKMNKEDRVAIHPAMEQHIIPINKGGFNTTLNSRCAILGAANPNFGRYDATRTFGENIMNFPSTLLSRFDLVFVIKDIPDKEKDRLMARHILGYSRRQQDVIPLSLFQKYIAYAKRVKPVLTKEAEKAIEDYYVNVRESSNIREENNPVAITPRQMEGLTRLSEAHARIALREEVLIEDTQAAIVILGTSLRQCGIDPRTGRGIDVIENPSTKKDISNTDRAVRILEAHQEEYNGDGMPEGDWIELMKQAGISESDTVKAIVNLDNQGKLKQPSFKRYEMISY